MAYPPLKLAEVVEERPAAAFVEDAGDELLDGVVVGRVGVDPARVDLGLVEGLEHVGLDACTNSAYSSAEYGSSGQAPTSVW